MQTQTITSTVVTNYGYDIANRLTSVNGQTYTWDNNGNLLNDGTSTNTYDQANRLKTVTQGTNNFAFAYNGVGDRLRQTVGVTSTIYALDPAAGLTHVLWDGASTYLYGNGRIAQQATTKQYFGADALGSVRQIYNSSGQVIANKRYDPYGNVLAQNGVGTSNYGFTGEWTDATGLEYLRARYYAPTVGRFTMRDVWEGDYESPQSMNGWTYGNSDPVNTTDPSGMTPRIPGVCPEPTGVNRNRAHQEYYTLGFNSQFFPAIGITFVYCGEFAVTAYQFVGQEKRYGSLPRAITTDSEGHRVSFNRDFIHDVNDNGTGQSNKVCSEYNGYFHYDPNLKDTDWIKDPMSFQLYCDKGRSLNPVADAYKVAAMDPNQLPSGGYFHLPYMCLPGESCDKRWHDYPTQAFPLKAADTGKGIKGFRLDVFTGQDIGPRGDNNNRSSMWSQANAHLGNYLPHGLLGLTPVYQMIFKPPSVIFPGIVTGGCDGQAGPM